MAMQKKHIGLYILVAIPVLIGAFLIVKELKAAKAKTTVPPPPAKTTPASTTGGCTFPLKNGSVNACVKQLQLALINAYGPTVLPTYGADGKWGSETDGAVLATSGGILTQIDDQNQLNDILTSLNATGN